jgi:hypothetical protein
VRPMAALSLVMQSQLVFSSTGEKNANFEFFSIVKGPQTLKTNMGLVLLENSWTS